MRKFGKIFAMAVFCVVASQYVVAGQGCRALVVVKNDLWFAQQDGTLLTQLTNDGNLKYAVALAPSSDLIAYSGKSSPADVTLIDSTGRLLADVNVHATDAITDLTWTSPGMLEARQHESPTSSRSYFLYVPPPAGPAQVLPTKGVGGSCALSPRGHGAACTAGDAISLNGRDIYFLPSPFSSSTVVQRINASIGTSVSTKTMPPFRIEVQNIRDEKVALKVTTPDGQWKQAYLGNGNVLSMPYPSGISDGSAVLYGIEAGIARNNNGVVTLTVMSNSLGAPAFEAGPVWDPKGKRIAFVESNGSSQRWLVLINREMGEADKPRGGHDARELLPIAGPVSSIAFTSDTHIVVKGQDSVFAQDIPAEGKVPSNAPYTTTPRLAQQINVTVGGSPTPVPVKGWTCQ
ncbi:exported protein of unknown function (plasmid) [Ralstonia solanacearum CMR15]|nr:exported protein of unknown function [Ralstonia solanacearum CMR15]